MSVNNYIEKLNYFIQRITDSFFLQEDTENLISQRRIALSWVID